MNRPRWTKSNAGELYISYFDILNSNSGVEYLEMIHESELYDELYYNIYLATRDITMNYNSVLHGFKAQGSVTKDGGAS